MTAAFPALLPLPQVLSSENLIATADKYLPKWLPPGSLSTACGLGLMGLAIVVTGICVTTLAENRH